MENPTFSIKMMLPPKFSQLFFSGSLFFFPRRFWAPDFWSWTPFREVSDSATGQWGWWLQRLDLLFFFYSWICQQTCEFFGGIHSSWDWDHCSDPFWVCRLMKASGIHGVQSANLGSQQSCRHCRGVQAPTRLTKKWADSRTFGEKRSLFHLLDSFNIDRSPSEASNAVAFSKSSRKSRTIPTPVSFVLPWAGNVWRICAGGDRRRWGKGSPQGLVKDMALWLQRLPPTDSISKISQGRGCSFWCQVIRFQVGRDQSFFI